MTKMWGRSFYAVLFCVCKFKKLVPVVLVAILNSMAYNNKPWQFHSIKIMVFLDVVSCTLVDIYQHSGGGCCLCFKSSTDKIKATSFSATLVSVYQTTQHHIPEDHILMLN
jgi:general stress protein CsbA